MSKMIAKIKYVLFFLTACMGLTLVAAPTRPLDIPQEQIFGAEIQYFRLRAGYGPNQSAQEVYQLWARALDAAKAAQMNMVSFYIPWDFHEYKEGKFDFTGSVDEDGDGKPDYPSRDVLTFLDMIEERGFKYVQVRPGPYINAEWGFLGFGAIPLWFHEKYPDSHMINAQGLRTKLYDYHHPELLRHTELWFKEVYEAIIKPRVGPNGIIKFVQVDNETNFMWQSIFNHDYGTRATIRYQEFLKNRYSNLSTLNQVHQRQWKSWNEVAPPRQRGQNLKEDQDWYRFQDQSVFEYLQKVRAVWENLGLKEPEVIFTLAESYNAAGSGLIPNHHLRNDPSIGLLTVNLYPKTYETPLKPFLNNPFKSDHDVIAQASASEKYLGKGVQWVMGPEIQGGWWKGIDVSTPARRQTYLSTVGHGMKAMLIYYFHEGQNWQTEWAKQQIEPHFARLKNTAKYRDVRESEIPDEFWRELQAIVDRELMVGFDVRGEMTRDQAEAQELFFDAPLDGRALPRGHFQDVLKIGQKVLQPHGAWLGKAESDHDPVCLLKDVADHVPNARFDHVKLNTDWESGLIGYALNSGVYPRILHWGIQTEEDLKDCKIVVRQDGGSTRPEIAAALQRHLQKGNTVVNLLEDSLAQVVVGSVKKKAINQTQLMRFSVLGMGDKFQALALDQYERRPGCLSILNGDKGEIFGYQCSVGTGRFVQVGAEFYGLYNSDDYGLSKDLSGRTSLFSDLAQANFPFTKSSVRNEAGGLVPQVVSFGRTVPGRAERWITVKNGRKEAVKVRVHWGTGVSHRLYKVKNLLNPKVGANDVTLVSGELLRQQGVELQLAPLESTVLWIEPDWSAIARPSSVR